MGPSITAKRLKEVGVDPETPSRLQFRQSMKSTNLDREIIRLRSKGQTLPQIQTWILANYNKKIACSDILIRIQRALKRVQSEMSEPELYRYQILDTLDMLQEAIVPLAIGEGENDEPNLLAVDRLMGIIDKKVKLLGLSEANKVEVKNTSDTSDWYNAMNTRLSSNREGRSIAKEMVIDMEAVGPAGAAEFIQLPEGWDEEEE